MCDLLSLVEYVDGQIELLGFLFIELALNFNWNRDAYFPLI
jgi:hypothetical protein